MEQEQEQEQQDENVSLLEENISSDFTNLEEIYDYIDSKPIPIGKIYYAVGELIKMYEDGNCWGYNPRSIPRKEIYASLKPPYKLFENEKDANEYATFVATKNQKDSKIWQKAAVFKTFFLNADQTIEKTEELKKLQILLTCKKFTYYKLTAEQKPIVYSAVFDEKKINFKSMPLIYEEFFSNNSNNFKQDLVKFFEDYNGEKSEDSPRKSSLFYFFKSRSMLRGYSSEAQNLINNLKKESASDHKKMYELIIKMREKTIQSFNKDIKLQEKSSFLRRLDFALEKITPHIEITPDQNCQKMKILD